MPGSCNLFSLLNKVCSILIGLLVIQMIMYSCKEPVKVQAYNNSNGPVYLNHSDSAHFVGMGACKLCHQAIYDSFLQTGMGKSLDVAGKAKSAGDFTNPCLYDPVKDLHYQACWLNDSLYIHEYRQAGKDTLHSIFRQVNYIIGSGQHTNSHLMRVNGYLTQMPMTFYTQKQKWDLPPGFENGQNTRFGRKIGLECMSCHNAYPKLVLGSENKYTSLPRGIDCERCHGAGSIHVALRSTGTRIDTSRYIDYSIVNPSKLPIDLQFDICQRCHLQGNTVLKEGQTFYDFKPGQKLSQVMSVFLPKYKNAEDEFIMASHADRLKQSTCFIRSYKKQPVRDSLRPYRESLTCITCHNPHLSVKSTQAEVFDKACQNCHGNNNLLAESHKTVKAFKEKNCFTCHMPVSGSTDIPHVSVHDHKIAKPLTSSDKKKIKIFLGLYSVNESHPSSIVKAKAYLNQYDKFEANAAFLDSAEYFLGQCSESAPVFHLRIQLMFTRSDYSGILKLVNTKGPETCLNKLVTEKSYENTHAWTAYRIGESYLQLGNSEKSLVWFSRAVDLAPYILDFRNKFGTNLAALNKKASAKSQFQQILNENPSFVSAYSNLGYLFMLENKLDSANAVFCKGLKWDPDNETLLLNLASLSINTGKEREAEKYLLRVLKHNPGHVKARQALSQISNKQ